MFDQIKEALQRWKIFQYHEQRLAVFARQPPSIMQASFSAAEVTVHLCLLCVLIKARLCVCVCAHARMCVCVVCLALLSPPLRVTEHPKSRRRAGSYILESVWHSRLSLCRHFMGYCFEEGSRGRGGDRGPRSLCTGRSPPGGGATLNLEDCSPSSGGEKFAAVCSVRLFF